jgi:toxin ParE1/3/4
VKPVRVRPRADRDIDLALAYLFEEQSPAAALRLAREMEAAVARIASHPRIGSPRYARLLKGLRFWPLRRFPYLIFYVEQAGFIDVLRVLHAARDIPAALREALSTREDL